MKERMGQHPQPKDAAEATLKSEATFEELPPEQQIQRLRLELRVMRELASSQQMLIDRLMVHEHKADGTMMLPMRSSGDRLMAGAGRRDNLA